MKPADKFLWLEGDDLRRANVDYSSVERGDTVTILLSGPGGCVGVDYTVVDTHAGSSGEIHVRCILADKDKGSDFPCDIIATGNSIIGFVPMPRSDEPVPVTHSEFVLDNDGCTIRRNGVVCMQVNNESIDAATLTKALNTSSCLFAPHKKEAYYD